MSLRVVVTVPLVSGPQECRIDQLGALANDGRSTPHRTIQPGEEIEYHLHSGQQLRISEVPQGTAAGERLKTILRSSLHGGHHV